MQRTQGADLLTGKGEDHQVAFAGGNYGEEAAVGRNGEFAERYAMEERDGGWLRYGDVVGIGRKCESWNLEGNEIAGFFFDGALEDDARFVGGPLKDAEANTKACDAIG